MYTSGSSSRHSSSSSQSTRIGGTSYQVIGGGQYIAHPGFTTIHPGTVYTTTSSAPMYNSVTRTTRTVGGPSYVSTNLIGGTHYVGGSSLLGGSTTTIHGGSSMLGGSMLGGSMLGNSMLGGTHLIGSGSMLGGSLITHPTLIGGNTTTTTTVVNGGSGGGMLMGGGLSGIHTCPASPSLTGGAWQHQHQQLAGGTTTTVTSTTKKYEWRVGSDGVLRQVVVESSENDGKSPNHSLTESTVTSQTNSQTSSPTGPSWAPVVRPEAIPSFPTINITPIAPGKTQSSSTTTTTTSTTTGNRQDSIDESKNEEMAELLRAARMRAAAEKFLRVSKEKKQETAIIKEREAEVQKRIAMEQELARLQATTAKTSTLEQQMIVMMQQIESMKIEQGQQQAMSSETMKAELEKEMARLKAEEEKRRIALELEIKQLKDQGRDIAEANQRREMELLLIKQQQEMISNSIKVEEEASKIVDQGEMFVAIDHPFRALMLKIHSLTNASGAFMETARRGQCIVRATLGQSDLSIAGKMTSTGIDWEELLNFSYMNERHLSITIENSQRTILGGVKIDVQDFLMHPDMCGLHEIPLTEGSGALIGNLRVTIQLTSEFVPRHFIAVKSRPLTSSSTTTTTTTITTTNKHQILSSVMSPFKSIKVFMRSDMELPMRETTCVRMILGNSVLTSPSPIPHAGAQWGFEFGMPFHGERFIIVEFYLVSNPKHIVASTSVDLETLLMTRQMTHAVTLTLKDGDRAVGTLPLGIEMSEAVAAAYASSNSSWASTETRTTGGALELMGNMKSLMTNQLSPASAEQAMQFGFGSMLRDTGFGLVPMGPSILDAPPAGGMAAMLRGAAPEPAAMPKPKDCKVQVHSVSDIMMSGGEPKVKVVVGNNEAETENAKVDGSGGATWRADGGCFTFELDVDSMIANNNNGTTPSNLILQVFDNENQLVGSAEMSMLPIITVSTGYFSGDVQLTKMVDGQTTRAGSINITVTTF